MAAAVRDRQREVAPVPADATRPVALRLVLLGVVWAFNRPVVRQVEPTPGGVVVVGLGRPLRLAGLRAEVAGAVALDRRQRHVALQEAPTGIQRQPLGGQGRKTERLSLDAGWRFLQG